MSRSWIRGCLGACIIAVALFVTVADSSSSDTSTGSGAGQNPAADVNAPWNKLLDGALTPRNRDADSYQYAKVVGMGDLEIQWPIDDNITDSLMTYGAKRDAVDILKAIKKSGLTYGSVFLSGVFPYTDKFGNVTETKVVSGTFPKATVDQIQFDTYDPERIWDLATDAKVAADWR